MRIARTRPSVIMRDIQDEVAEVDFLRLVCFIEQHAGHRSFALVIQNLRRELGQDIIAPSEIGPLRRRLIRATHRRRIINRKW